MNFHISQDPRHTGNSVLVGPDGASAVVVHGTHDDARFILSVINGDPVDFPADATPGPWTFVQGRSISIVSEADGGSRLVATLDGERTFIASAIVERSCTTSPSPSF